MSDLEHDDLQDAGLQDAGLQDAIAILSVALRFPGARTDDELWSNLRDGVESITRFSEQELRAAGVSSEQLQDSSYVRARGVLSDIDLFDPEGFAMTQREAETTDPQHRLLLECAFEALESAGYGAPEQPGPVGIFVGSGESRYLSAEQDEQAILGSSREFLATKISYKLNLKGPGLTVQTACSTSLVAVHLAAKSLLDGESDMALAGGASIRLPQTRGYLYQPGGVGSPDGHCRAFDQHAEGTVGSHGVGIVLLKRLEDAVRDGDPVRAVIRATAINNDGSDKVGFSAPSVAGQAAVVAEALALADLDPSDVSYVEAHGTGTPLGDPIEVKALNQAFGPPADPSQRCALGSIKSNLGHLDTAAGIAGLIKTVLALEHRMLPPSLHYEAANQEIDFESGPFRVVTELTPWESEGPRRAGVSSFGIGGTNVHVVLEEAPQRPAAEVANAPSLLLLSARSESALEQATLRLSRHLETHEALDLADVAYTLRVGRRQHEVRRMAVCTTVAQAAERLRSPEPPAVMTGTSSSETTPIVFLFPGQGAQSVGMGRELYETEASFREPLDACCERLLQPLGCDLRDILYPSNADAARAAERLEQTAIAQPALFVVQYALARYLEDQGIRPAAMLGHSLGEYVAACLAGVVSLHDALHLVATRGALMQKLAPGSMLAVDLGEEDAASLLGPGLALAAINGPRRTVLSGTPEAIGELEGQLAEREVPARRLRTSHAFHSAMMEPVLTPFASHLRAASLNPPKLPVVSNLTGRELRVEEATDPAYWSRHLRSTVRFSAGVQHVLADPRFAGCRFLEVGPGRALSALTQSLGGTAIPTLPRDGEGDHSQVLQALGRLWLDGVSISPSESSPRRRLRLPGSVFDRRRCWIEDPVVPASQTAEPSTPAAASPAAVSPTAVSPVAVSPAAGYEAGVEDLIRQQLQLISQQLTLLQAHGPSEPAEEPLERSHV
ncbi:MAG: type I polyketide synthase [Acidobacteriota bacterium]